MPPGPGRPPSSPERPVTTFPPEPSTPPGPAVQSPPKRLAEVLYQRRLPTTTQAAEPPRRLVEELQLLPPSLDRRVRLPYW